MTIAIQKTFVYLNLNWKSSYNTKKENWLACR